MATPLSMQDLSFPVRDGSHVPCIGSEAFSPLNHQGNPLKNLNHISQSIVIITQWLKVISSGLESQVSISDEFGEVP